MRGGGLCGGNPSRLEEPVQRSLICLYHHIGVLGGARHAIQITGKGAGDHIGYPAFVQSLNCKLRRLFANHGRISRPSR
jgi:hypothetical protein